MKSNKITFIGSQGEPLAARVDMPADENSLKGFVLFAHCFTCSKNLRAVGHISKALVNEGIGVFRFDFTGLGESKGDFSNTNFTSNVEDIILAAKYMSKNLQPPKLLMGHSLGGAAVLQAAIYISSIEAISTIGAPCSPDHLKLHFKDNEEEIRHNGFAHVQLAGREFMIKKQFLDNLDEHNMSNVINELDKALLIFHSPIDETVGIEHAAHIYHLAKHPKSFISLDKADHLLTNENDAEYVGLVTATWSSRYLFKNN